MDLADASLVAVAESLGLHRIFTLDSDFRVYRINGSIAFEVVP
jgi:predicted nucleic acid-binding protein